MHLIRSLSPSVGLQKASEKTAKGKDEEIGQASWFQTGIPTNEIYAHFARDGFPASECDLPQRCGMFGVCEDSQCVACPLSSKLIGWSKNCEPLPACGSNKFYYYKLEGVDHSSSKYESVKMKEVDCGKKCSSDCKCSGYFFNKEISKCFIAYDLLTLAKVENSTHVGYIKAPKL
ncbi:hypothetical protein DM860_017947 [Cuscuta australis]|uniref:Apple domain-containing protein n=1 Tax=Cuscuta australis TaxID=267555 RepID=A0A328D2Z4_9ASTE|nr:hypothetical protein DM860_017947 [Cuscuta australis]